MDYSHEQEQRCAMAYFSSVYGGGGGDGLLDMLCVKEIIKLLKRNGDFVCKKNYCLESFMNLISKCFLVKITIAALFLKKLIIFYFSRNM